MTGLRETKPGDFITVKDSKGPFSIRRIEKRTKTTITDHLGKKWANTGNPYGRSNDPWCRTHASPVKQGDQEKITRRKVDEEKKSLRNEISVMDLSRLTLQQLRDVKGYINAKRNS